jgi:hypothetical protein
VDICHIEFYSRRIENVGNGQNLKLAQRQAELARLSQYWRMFAGRHNIEIYTGLHPNVKKYATHIQQPTYDPTQSMFVMWSIFTELTLARQIFVKNSRTEFHGN